MKRKKVDYEEIVRLHLEGMTAEEIIMQLGCCKSTISRALNNAGYSMKPGTDKGKVLALYQAGWSISDIRWEMKIEEKEVRQILSEKLGEEFHG